MNSEASEGGSLPATYFMNKSTGSLSLTGNFNLRSKIVIKLKYKF